MKFSCSVEINLPRTKLVELWSNPDHLEKWQNGFLSFKHLSGIKGEPGAKSSMMYKIGRGEMELIETILSNNLPDEFTGEYEAKTMVNTMKNSFTVLNEEQTRWEAELEYTKLNGIIPKLMAWLMPGIFKKQTQKWLQQFKEFAESESIQGS